MPSKKNLLFLDIFSVVMTSIYIFMVSSNYAINYNTYVKQKESRKYARKIQKYNVRQSNWLFDR